MADTDHEEITLAATEVSIPAARVRDVLVVGVFLLTVGHLLFIVPDVGPAHLFDLDRESGPGTWVSTMLYAGAALAAVWLALRLRPPSARSLGFAAMALVLLALGAEEVMAFHETASLEIATAADLPGADSGGTPLMGLVLLPFFAGGTWLLARGMSARPRRLLAEGVGIWWVATFATEQLDAWNLHHVAENPDRVLAIHQLVTGIQEGGEMLGVGLVAVALLEELGALGGELRLRVVPTPD